MIAPPVPIVAIDYLEDDQRRWRWVAVENKAKNALYSCSATIYYHEVPAQGDEQSSTMRGQSLARSKTHVLGSGDGTDENAKTAMRRWVRSELRATFTGLAWHEDEISVTCQRE